MTTKELIPDKKDSFTDDKCPLKSTSHIEHDEHIRQVGKEVVLRVEQMEKYKTLAEQAVAKAKEFDIRLNELQRSMTESPNRTARILAERCFELEQQNSKLRERIRSVDK